MATKNWISTNDTMALAEIISDGVTRKPDYYDEPDMSKYNNRPKVVTIGQGAGLIPATGAWKKDNPTYASFNSGPGSLSGTGNSLTNSNSNNQSPYAKKAGYNHQWLMDDAKQSANQIGAVAGQMSGAGTSLINSGSNYYNSGMANAGRWAIEDVGDAVNRADENAALSSEAAYRAGQERLQERGINPNSGRFSGMAERHAINSAALRAGVRNQARVSARQRNYANSLGIAQGGISGVSAGGSLASQGQYAYANQARIQSGLADRWRRTAIDENTNTGQGNAMKQKGWL